MGVPKLRPLTESDHADVLALNARNVEMLAPLSEERLVELHGIADRWDVLDVAGRFAGFVLTFTAHAPYDSENFRWFGEHYGEGFYYLDRIVLDDAFRRRGLGGFVYDAVETTAASHGRLALEVNLEPRNDASLAFHDRRGFVEVGRLGDATHLVSLMVKELA